MPRALFWNHLKFSRYLNYKKFNLLRLPNGVVFSQGNSWHFYRHPCLLTSLHLENYLKMIDYVVSVEILHIFVYN